MVVRLWLTLAVFFLSCFSFAHPHEAERYILSDREPERVEKSRGNLTLPASEAPGYIGNLNLVTKVHEIERFVLDIENHAVMYRFVRLASGKIVYFNYRRDGTSSFDTEGLPPLARFEQDNFVYDRVDETQHDYIFYLRNANLQALVKLVVPKGPFEGAAFFNDESCTVSEDVRGICSKEYLALFDKPSNWKAFGVVVNGFIDHR